MTCAQQDSGARARDLWRQGCEHLCFIESLRFFCYFSQWDIRLAFVSLIPHGELMPFLAQCGPFTLTYRGSTARIGTSLWQPDSLLACFICSRRYWHGS